MAYWLIVVAVLSRFVPHVWNFSPVYGALLFGGAHLKKRDHVWFPVALLGVSDFVLTNLIYRLDIGWMELVQMAAFASIALIGGLLRNHATWRRLLGASLAAPVAFYLISNFGVWWGWHSYAHTWQGLLECYLAAIPDFRHTVVSSCVFTAVFFGAYEIYKAKHRVARQPEPR